MLLLSGVARPLALTENADAIAVFSSGYFEYILPLFKGVGGASGRENTPLA